MKNRFLTLAMAATLALAACSQPGQSGGINKQQGGTALGAIAGGIAGHSIGKGTGNTVATIGGAVLGGMAGNSVGGSLDKADNQAAYGTRTSVGVDANTQYALENVGTGRSYNGVTPTRTYVSNGRNCRDYTVSAAYGTNYGSACRMSNGAWVSN